MFFFYLFIFILKHLHAVLHSNDDKESIATMESELDQFNIASVSHDNVMGAMTSGKNKFSIKIKLVRQMGYLI